jgi:hypothetical protein
MDVVLVGLDTVLEIATVGARVSFVRVTIAESAISPAEFE